MYCILFIQLFNDGQLGCFFLWAIMNNVAMKMGDKYLFEILPFLLAILYPEVELLVHMVILCLTL